MSERKPMGYWMNIDNVIAEAQKIIKEGGVKDLPSKQVLIKRGHSSFSLSIIKYHGGFNKFRELLGENQKRVRSGSWQSLEYTLAEAKKLIEREGWDNLPGANILRKVDCSDLSNAISKYHGGFYHFRKLLRLKEKVSPPGRWKNLEYSIEQANRAIEDGGLDKLPGQDTLTEMGYGKLANAISRFHGGFPVFRELLRERLTGRTEAEQLESLLEQYAGWKEE